MTPPMKGQAQSDNGTFDYFQQAQLNEPYLSRFNDNSRGNISAQNTGQFAAQQALVPDGLTTQFSGPGSWPSATTNGPTSNMSEGHYPQGYNTATRPSPDTQRERQKTCGSAPAYTCPEDAVSRSFDGNYVMNEHPHIQPSQESAIYSQPLTGACISSPNLALASNSNGSPTGGYSAWPTSAVPFSPSASQRKPQVLRYNGHVMQDTGLAQTPSQSRQFMNKEIDSLSQTPRSQGLFQLPTSTTPRSRSLTNTPGMPPGTPQTSHSSSNKHPRIEAMAHMQQPSAYLFGNNMQGQPMTSSNTVPKNAHPGNATYNMNMTQLPYKSPAPHGNPYASQMVSNYGASSFHGTNYGHQPVLRSTNLTSPNNLPWGHTNAEMRQHQGGFFHNIPNVNAQTGQMSDQYYDNLLAQYPQLEGYVLSRVQENFRAAQQAQSHIKVPVNATPNIREVQPPGWHISTRQPMMSPQQRLQRQGENAPSGHETASRLQWAPTGVQQPQQPIGTYQQPVQPAPANGTNVVATQLRNLGPADWDRNFASTSPSPVPDNPPPVKRYKRSNKTVKGTPQPKTKSAPKRKLQRKRKPEGYYNNSVANSVLQLIQDSDFSSSSKDSKSPSPEMLPGANTIARGGLQPVSQQTLLNTNSDVIAAPATSINGPPNATSMSAAPNRAMTQDEARDMQSGGPSADPKSDSLPSRSGDSANPYHVHESELLTPEGRKAAVLRALNQAFMDNPFAIPNSDYQPSKLNELAQHPRSRQAHSNEQTEDVNNDHAESAEEAWSQLHDAAQFGTATHKDAQKNMVDTEMHGGDAANTESMVQQLTTSIQDSETAPPNTAAESTSPPAPPAMTPQESPEPGLTPSQSTPFSTGCPQSPPPPTPAQAFECAPATAPDQDHTPVPVQTDQALHTNPTTQDQEFDVFGLNWDTVDDDDLTDLLAGTSYMGTDDLLREFESHETPHDSTS